MDWHGSLFWQQLLWLAVLSASGYLRNHRVRTEEMLQFFLFLEGTVITMCVASFNI
jgi:hypothetical protein